MSFASALFFYLIGGLTFIPLLLAALFCLGYLLVSKPAEAQPPSSLDHHLANPDDTNSDGALGHASEKKTELHNGQAVTAAYLAVCREYVPGGINGKPPERSTPAGEVLISESPSVYQSMYRSIFERGKTQIPTIEGDKKDRKAVKKARNVFFVVLRHGHLMLFDDSEQLEVRHVISLVHHTIDLYDGGVSMTEGDLWAKRNCIRLSRVPLEGAGSSRPFYFFSDNCSEKEDFYHALLATQRAICETNPPPPPQLFETPHVIKLVQNLHASDNDPHSRWLNAILGRVFLGLYQTEELAGYIRTRINRKIARVSKPNFITSIQVQDVDMGDSAPVITNPKLKEFTIDGDMIVEADIKYNGGFKLEIAAIARIDLGSRFKAREVDLVLAGVLRRLTGRLLIKIKPPPSNRLWFTFEKMPQLELTIEPVVSSRQITYSVVLRAIESRIREVFGETLVQPNWDDIPFLNTAGNRVRGGIWERAKKTETLVEAATRPNSRPESVVESALQQASTEASSDSEEFANPAGAHPLTSGSVQKRTSMPSLLELPQKKLPLTLRKSAGKSAVSLDGRASSTSISTNQALPTMPLAPRHYAPTDPPRSMRSQSFVSAAAPLVSVEDTEAVKPEVKRRRGQRDAVDLVKEFKVRHKPNGHVDQAEGSEQVAGRHSRHVSADLGSVDVSASNLAQDDGVVDYASLAGDDIARRESDPVAIAPLSGDTGPAITRPTPSATFPTPTLRSGPHDMRDDSVGPTLPSSSSLGSGASSTKKWGWQMLNRQGTVGPNGSTTSLFSRSLTAPQPPVPPSSNVPKPPHADALKAAAISSKAPMGRGQPLPPIGTPLPGPAKSLWAASTLNLGSMKRKPVPPPLLPPRQTRVTSVKHSADKAKTSFKGTPPPPLPARNVVPGQEDRHEHEPAHEQPHEDNDNDDDDEGAGEEEKEVEREERDEEEQEERVEEEEDDDDGNHEDNGSDMLVVAAPDDASRTASPSIEFAEESLDESVPSSHGEELPNHEHEKDIMDATAVLQDPGLDNSEESAPVGEAAVARDARDGRASAELHGQPVMIDAEELAMLERTMGP